MPRSIPFLLGGIAIPLALLLCGSAPAQSQSTRPRFLDKSLADASNPAGTIERTIPSKDSKVIKLKGVNSDARDNNPIITADGNILFFNSTRKGDRPWAHYNIAINRYDDDIYYASRSVMRGDEESWNAPVNLGPLVNTSADDGIAAISPD